MGEIVNQKLEQTSDECQSGYYITGPHFQICWTFDFIRWYKAIDTILIKKNCDRIYLVSHH